MELQDYLKILRARWQIIVASTLIVSLGSLGVSLLTTPVYAATAQLFVSTAGGGTVNDAYQGGRYSQERVSSYRELITGDLVASEAIDDLELDISPRSLSSRVTSKSAPDTVLIDLTVQDSSPELARDLANAIAENFTALIADLETPEGGGPPAARVTVVEEAVAPSTPIAPTTQRNVILGLAVGLLLGIGLAVLRDRLDNTVKDRKTLEEVGDVALIGAMPFEKDRIGSPAINFGDPRSLGAEAYRALRTNLQFLNIDNAPKSFVITSSLPSEGKSTTAVNLALVLAESGHSVALVEADLRRPRVTKYLGLVRAVGLTTVLAGQASLDDVLQPTAYSGLTVLGAGPIPPNPSELLGSAQAKQLFKELRKRFDYVVIDAPPLLPVTDGAVLTKISDGALVVARHGHTKRDELARSLRNLENVDATVLGTILTMIPMKATSSYEYSYYYPSDTDGPKQSKAYPVKPGPE